MRNFKTLVAGFLVSILAVGAIAATSPFPTWIYEFPRKSLPVKTGNDFSRSAQAVYDVAALGGASTAIGLGVFLPASSIIKRSYFHVITPFSHGGNATLALHCEDAGNIKAATAATWNANTLVEGESTGASSAFKLNIGSACQITATPATQPLTAGKIRIFIDYDVSE